MRLRSMIALGLALTVASPAAAQLGLIGADGGLPAGGGSSYSAEATALFAAMTSSPDSTRKGLIDTAIVCLKTDGVWAKEDWVTVFAAGNQHDAMLNWKTPSKTLSAVGAPSFSVDAGFNGTADIAHPTGWAAAAAANYLIAPENLDNSSTPSPAHVYALNDAHLSVYVSKFTRDNYAAWIATNSAYNGGMGQQTSAQQYDALVNDAATGSLQTGIDGTAADVIGMWSASRTGSAAGNFYKSGSPVNGLNAWSDTASSSSVPTTPQRILWGDGNNYWNPPANTTRLAYYSSGSSFSSTDAANEASCITAYLSALGAS